MKGSARLSKFPNTKRKGLMNKRVKDNPSPNQIMPRGALRAVREHLEDPRNSERKVAQYVLVNGDEANATCALFARPSTKE
jgi:hypothetical protein